MSAILFLIIIGIIVAGGFLLVFIWAVKSGQYDDSFSPSVRMLFDNKDSDNDKKDKGNSVNQNNKVEPLNQNNKQN
jgi:cbb3-type cytochrome oxidase maturation protein